MQHEGKEKDKCYAYHGKRKSHRKNSKKSKIWYNFFEGYCKEVQIREKSLYATHPLHKMTTQTATPRLKKQKKIRQQHHIVQHKSQWQISNHCSCCFIHYSTILICYSRFSRSRKLIIAAIAQSVRALVLTSSERLGFRSLLRAKKV